MKTFGGIIAALTVVVVFLPSTTEADMVDFSGLVAGQIVDDEYAAMGLTIEADNFNLGDDQDWAIVFDTSCGSGALPACTGGDADLGTPGSTVGNAAGTDLGNSLILSEGGTDTSPADGIQDEVPDDEGRRPAGSILFSWDYPISSLGFHLIDIEDDNFEEFGYTIAFANGGSGFLGLMTFDQLQTRDPSIVYGNNSVNWINPITAGEFKAGETWFNQALVTFYGSGSIDTLTWQRVPEPSSLLLFGAGLGILTIARRRRF